MSVDTHPDAHGHGHSVAAWTGVIICLIGSFVIAAGVWWSNHPVAIIGGVIFCAGGIIGWAMGRVAKGRATKHGAMDSQRKPA